MIADLKPYPEYKESGSQCLGQVPAHWEVFKPKQIGTLLKGVGGTKEDSRTEGVPCVRYGELYTTHNYFIKRPKAFVHPDRAASYMALRYGDVLFAASGEKLDEIGKSAVNLIEGDAICGGDVIVLRPRIAVHAPYLGYALDCRPSAIQKSSMGRGTTVKHIYPDELKQLRFPLPPPSEQAAIVRFLDWANGRLERAIRAKRKIVALLNEQKQAIIHRAVTRGLDPNVRLKPSGIPWLGEIPEHWEVSALRRYWKVTDCKHLTVPFVDEGIPLASVVEVQSFSLDLSRCKRTKPDWYRMLIEGDRKPKRDDLIYCRNASVGACALVETDIDFAMGQDVCLIRSLSQNQRFLNYVLHSSFMKHQLELLLVGSTFKRINISEIKTLCIIVPPKLEQDVICEFLDGAVMGYDTAISCLEREIDLLREYRTRLVADVVTGKIDVQEVAATLPDEAQLDAAPEDDFDSLDADESLEEEEGL